MEFIPAKTILQKAKTSDKWFSLDYNMNLYRGCHHGCIYCDSRSECYNIPNFDDVRIKENCIVTLESDLSKKRKKGIVGMGAMSDPYNAFEEKYCITRHALELINKYKFGVSIATKSDLITRDIDILKEISKHSEHIIKITITTTDDNLSRIIEPNVCVSSKRFEAIKKLSDNRLFTGVLFMPVLPFISDTKENVINMVRLSHINGAKFIYFFNGVTLRDNQREYYYEKLDKYFPGVKDKYIETYKNSYACNSKNAYLYDIFQSECEKYGILYKMKDIIKEYKNRNIDEQVQMNFFEVNNG